LIAQTVSYNVGIDSPTLHKEVEAAGGHRLVGLEVLKELRDYHICGFNIQGNRIDKQTIPMASSSKSCREQSLGNRPLRRLPVAHQGGNSDCPEKKREAVANARLDAVVQPATEACIPVPSRRGWKKLQVLEFPEPPGHVRRGGAGLPRLI
jgi:hypothetical protein